MFSILGLFTRNFFDYKFVFHDSFFLFLSPFSFLFFLTPISEKEKKCPIDLSSNDLLDIFTPTTATQQTTQNKQGQPQESSSEQQDERKQKIVTVLSQVSFSLCLPFSFFLVSHFLFPVLSACFFTSRVEFPGAKEKKGKLLLWIVFIFGPPTGFCCFHFGFEFVSIGTSILLIFIFPLPLKNTN